MSIYIILIIILLVLRILNKKKEGNENTSSCPTNYTCIPTEGAKNISSMYKNGKLQVDSILMKNKWLLEPGEDHWIRLKNPNNPSEYYGGIAAKEGWFEGDLHVSGNINAANNKHGQCVWKHSGFLDGADDNWKGVECDNGYFMAGIQRTHATHAPHWKHKYRIKCCTI
jgi:hypothetical protein